MAETAWAKSGDSGTFPDVGGGASGASRGQKQQVCLLQKRGSAWVAYDDVTGLELNAEEVYGARMTEIDYVEMKQVWVKIPRAVAKANGWKVGASRRNKRK